MQSICRDPSAQGRLEAEDSCRVGRGHRGSLEGYSQDRRVGRMEWEDKRCIDSRTLEGKEQSGTGQGTSRPWRDLTTSLLAHGSGEGFQTHSCLS